MTSLRTFRKPQMSGRSLTRAILAQSTILEALFESVAKRVGGIEKLDIFASEFLPHELLNRVGHAAVERRVNARRDVWAIEHAREHLEVLARLHGGEKRRADRKCSLVDGECLTFVRGDFNIFHVQRSRVTVDSLPHGALRTRASSLLRRCSSRV